MGGIYQKRGIGPTAVSQLFYPEATVAKWHFPQENATFFSSSKGT
jgi:hypothetical protein